LLSVKGAAIRPTSDRLRESIFNIYSADLVNIHVLDLFAGTGALAIEAMSRGAPSAVLVDKSTAALAVIRKNLVNCGFHTVAKTIRWDIRRNLNCLRSSRPRFGLVFMDPPYAKGYIQPTLKYLLRSESLAPQAHVIVEHDRTEPIESAIAGFSITDQRRYGKTLVSFLTTML
jgi:16S rRNA (guanine966-N2)-methyltransferase